MSRTIDAVFEQPELAEQAAQELRLAGFSAGQLQLEQSQTGPLEALLPKEQRAQPTVLRVMPEGRYLEAAALLYRYGGQEPERPRPAAGAAGNGERTGEALELVSEDLRPRIAAVPVGEVIVSKKVVTERRTLEVEVLREEIVVERAPAPSSVDPIGERSAEPGAHILGADEEITRVPLYEEQVIIDKRPVIREHVVIHKRRTPRIERLEGDVRREVPRVTKTGKARVEDGTKTPTG